MVHIIDEYNISKKCYNCWQNIKNIKINQNFEFYLLAHFTIRHMFLHIFTPLYT